MNTPSILRDSASASPEALESAIKSFNEWFDTNESLLGVMVGSPITAGARQTGKTLTTSGWSHGQLKEPMKQKKRNRQDTTTINNNARKKDIAKLAARMDRMDRTLLRHAHLLDAIEAVVKPLMLKRKR